MSTLCDGLDSNISAIVAQWKQLTNRPPWTTLSESDWVDHLPPLLRAMIEGVVCHGGLHAARQRVVEQAILHGAHRRRHGLSLDNILEEQAQLRQATWRFLTEKAESVVNSAIVTEIIRLDSAWLPSSGDRANARVGRGCRQTRGKLGADLVDR